MKTKLLLSIIVLFTIFTNINAQNVNIPDKNFKAYLIANKAINTNADNEIQVSEAEAYKGEIEVPSMQIYDLTGIEAFTSLTWLDCSSNRLSKLDITKNKELLVLACDGNKIKSLNVTENRKLNILWCLYNQLANLDVSENVFLVQINCSFNQIVSLDFSKNKLLKRILCNSNQLISLNARNGKNELLFHFSLDGNPNLLCIEVDDPDYMDKVSFIRKDGNASFSMNCSSKAVFIPDTNFKKALISNPSINMNRDMEIQFSEAGIYKSEIIVNSLNINDLTGIEAFTELSELHCNNNKLKNLDISVNKRLKILNCENNELDSLIVKVNTYLKEINCGNNNLQNLIVSENKALTSLRCYNNRLTNLDVSTNKQLSSLLCNNNQLTNLNVSNNKSLIDFWCNNNELNTLNLKNGNNTKLKYFRTYSNNLSCIQVDSIEFMNKKWLNAKDLSATYRTDCSSNINFNPLSEEVSIFPNPTSGTLNFPDFYNIAITDLAGKIISEEKQVKTIDISNHPSGIYYISLYDSFGNLIHRNKVCKE